MQVLWDQKLGEIRILAINLKFVFVISCGHYTTKPMGYKHLYQNYRFHTDVCQDIQEVKSGYFAECKVLKPSAFWYLVVLNDNFSYNFCFVVYFERNSKISQ